MTHATQQTGLRGEQIAQAFLRSQGFRIEAFNWRMGKLGELDIIAFHPQQGLLSFIEVKTRKGARCGSPQEAVTARKISQILQLAEAYLGQHPPQGAVQIRFDVIGVFFPGGGKPAEIQHIEDAFGADG